MTLRKIYDGPLHDIGEEVSELLEKHGYELVHSGGPRLGEYIVVMLKDGAKVEVKVTYQ